MSVAKAAIGTLLKRGDGGVGAGTQASKTVSTSNQQIIAKALKAGTAGNSKTFAIIVSGNNTAFSYTITANALTITSATDGSAVATTTVDDAIVAIQNDPIYRAHWQLTTGAGNGSGVLVASASSALTGGAEGTEVFTTIPGVLDLGGPSQTQDLIDVTSHDSPNRRREYILGLIDGGELTFELNYNSAQTQHQELYTDFVTPPAAGRNYQILFTDGTLFELTGHITNFEFSSPLDGQYKANVSIKITGDVTLTPAS